MNWVIWGMPLFTLAVASIGPIGLLLLRRLLDSWHRGAR